MMKVSAVLVIVLGFIMVGRGLSLSGVGPAYAASPGTGNVAKIQGNVQVVTTDLAPGSYPPIIVQKGIPVKWNMRATADNLNGCNETLTIPKYNIEKKLQAGDNIIEFTPEEEGNLTYTCWMGMISSNIKVVSDLSGVSGKDIDQLNSSNQSGASGGGCCGAGS
jgi:plastocyanin domain-containing protein